MEFELEFNREFNMEFNMENWYGIFNIEFQYAFYYIMHVGFKVSMRKSRREVGFWVNPTCTA